MAPSREKRKPVFDPNAIDDVLDAGWSAPAVRPLSAPPPPAADSHLRAVPREETPTTAPPPVAPERIEESARRAPARRPAEPTTRTTKSSHPGARAPRPRPPEVLLSADVYQRLAQVSAKEKLDKPSKARPFGVIVMDALEHHAQQLATAWTQDEPATPVGGALFIRPVATVSSPPAPPCHACPQCALGGHRPGQRPTARRVCGDLEHRHPLSLSRAGPAL